MNYTFHVELFSESYEESMKLNELHHEEINLFDEPLEVNVEAYKQAEDLNSMMTFTVRDEQEAMVGYSIFFIYNPTHHKTSVHAKQDVLFIKREHRGIGKEFIKYCDEVLQEVGVKRVHQCVPKINDWSKLLLSMGYSETETIYTRRL